MIWFALLILFLVITVPQVIAMQRRINAAEHSRQMALWDCYMGLLAKALMRPYVRQRKHEV
jgi:hypothetical protein